MCDALERAARRAARLAELNAAATLHGDEQHEAEHMRTDDGREMKAQKETKKAVRVPPEADSDATTVPAKTPEAKKHAAAGFAAAKLAAEKQAEQQAEPATPNPPSKPSLKREVQSKEVLAETAPDVPEVPEPQGKRLRRMEGHELKQGSSTEEMQPQKNQQHGPPIATAVKAKAAPTVKVETKAPHEPQAQAVAECLQRSSTQDMEVAAAQATQGKQKVAEKKVSGASDPPPPPNPDDHESDSSESDSEERRKKAALIKAKKEAHARYMRFHRSLTSKKSPPEIRAVGAAAYRDTQKLQMLLEQWTQCQGQWKQSDFWFQLTQKRRNRTFGCRRWMTRTEMLQKFGDQESVRQIIAAKMDLDEQVRDTQVRKNPDLHGLDTEETRQYLIWDREGEENTVDEVATSLFRAAEQGTEGSEEPPRKKKKPTKGKKKDAKSHKQDKKKKKKSTSSDSSGSSSNSSSSKDSSSSAQGKKPRNAKGKRGDDQETPAEKERRLKKEAEAERKKKEKEEEAEQKKKEREVEAEKKRLEKARTDALKKEQRKGNQVVSKLGSMVYTASSLDEKLTNLSAHVVSAIQQEVQPHINEMKSYRSKLQNSIDAAKVDDYGDLTEMILQATKVAEKFDGFCKAYKIK